MWTIDELVGRVREALAAEYSGAPNGRVRDMPDRRAIRWYTTIGLVDKPLGMRGRTALYGPRHLQQLVAIKRLQASGRSLAQIQTDFTWLTPSGLSEVSRVPEDLLDDSGSPQPDEPTEIRGRFWADEPAGPTPDSWHSPTPSAPSTPDEVAPAPSPASASPSPARLGLAAQPAAAVPQAALRPLSAVALDGGAILVVPQTLTDRDRADIVVAAAPLLSLLADRGLIDGRKS